MLACILYSGTSVHCASLQVSNKKRNGPGDGPELLSNLMHFCTLSYLSLLGRTTDEGCGFL